MKIYLLAFVALFLAVTPAAAQFDGSRGSFGGCPTCGVISYVDLPQPEQTVKADAFVITGWGFECVSGRKINRIEVWYQNYDGHYLLLPQINPVVNGQHRGDVLAAFGTTCPLMVADTGWSLTVQGMPLGLRRVVIIVWHGAYLERHDRTYLVR